jgi:replication initiation protein RepC
LSLFDEGPWGQVAEALASTSLRKLSPAMVVYKQQATTFAGLECGITHFYVLKDAAPAMGLKPQVVVCVEQLWRSSRPQDWEPGSRPIVWPSNASLCAALGISESRLKELIRQLCELGLVVMEDSPSGRRDGKRNKAGRIIEAWGFDLSLFAVRMAEFKRLTDEWRARQARLKQLHKERSRARKEAQQLVDCLQTAGLIDELPADFADRVERADIAAKRAKDIAALEASTVELRQLAEEARAVVVRAHAAASGAAEESPESGPEGPENRPLTLILKKKN